MRKRSFYQVLLKLRCVSFICGISGWDCILNLLAALQLGALRSAMKVQPERVSQPADIAEKKSRVQAVDALRGLALAGMLLVHFQYYVHVDGVWSQRCDTVIDFFAVDRFYPVFALLSGTGFALQFARWENRHGFVMMHLRRLGALMLFAVFLIALTGYHVLESYA